MNSPANSEVVVDQAMTDAGAVVLRGRTKASTRSMSATERQPTIDHDDLLALLDRPRPAHGDLHVLLKRRSVMRGNGMNAMPKDRSEAAPAPAAAYRRLP
jgi:hypothetical protein